LAQERPTDADHSCFEPCLAHGWQAKRQAHRAKHCLPLRRNTMSTPKIDKAKGQIKEAVGKATGDKQLEAEGQVEQTSATVREKAAEIKDDVAEAVGNAFERVSAVASEIKDKVTGKG
jgi:uncharacterized protein YjbJ (UPF0337 family)